MASGRDSVRVLAAPSERAEKGSTPRRTLGILPPVLLLVFWFPMTPASILLAARSSFFGGSRLKRFCALVPFALVGCASEAVDGGMGNCPADQLDCGQCTDVNTSLEHCGSCGHPCDLGQTCSLGQCVPGAAGSGGLSGGGGAGAGVGGAGGGSTGGASTGGASSGGSAAGGSQTSSGGDGGAGGGNVGGGVGVGGSPNAGGTPGSGGGSGTGGSSGSCGATGFYVEQGKLYDVNCNEFIMRGVNYPYVWFTQYPLAEQLGAIAAAGANVVRLVLGSGQRWGPVSSAEISTLISAAKAAKLVALLEVHDTTGYAEQSESVPLSSATQYWQSIAAALQGEEAFVLINIGNEPNGNDTTSSWAPTHVTAVEALRSAGLEHTLVVDAPNWGQDWENTMRDGAGSAIWDADSQKNLIFSVHMYQVYSSGETVSSYFQNFLANYEAPLIVGEFAADHGTSGDVDEARIMSDAESLGIGYLGWSWSGNGDGLGSLDIVNDFQAGSYTPWGSSLTTNLAATSETCTCFD